MAATGSSKIDIKSESTVDFPKANRQPPSATIPNATLLDAVRRFGTPTYLYNTDVVLNQYHRLINAFKSQSKNQYGVRVLYAMKANFCPAILKVLLGAGAYIDAVSPAEVFLALAIGFPSSHILFTVNNATDEDMEAVQKRGVLCNIGSLSRLRKHAKNFPGENVCIRFNPNVTAGEHEIVQTGTPKCKFGIALHNAGEVAKIVREHKLRVVGIHQHTGSGIDDPASIIAAVESIVSTLSFFDLAQLQFVDIGGGFKVKYKPDDHAVNLPAVAKEIDRVLAPLCEAHARALATKTKTKISQPRLQLYLEPGKFLVAECGHLLVKVNTVKRRRDRVILGTDSGFGHLLRPILYQAYHPIRNLSATQRPNTNTPLDRCDVVGNICESGDVFGSLRPLPAAREGDVLSIDNAGAYAFSMASMYNLRALPAEVVYSKTDDTSGNFSMKSSNLVLVRPRRSHAQVAEHVLTEYSKL